MPGCGLKMLTHVSVAGNYSVGVHIADVSHFIQPDSALDKVAAERCVA